MRFILSLLLWCCCIASAVRSVPPLILAVQSNNMSFIGSLIRGGVNVNATDALGYTAAHYAVLRDNLPAFELLLANGADPNITTNTGQTLLDVAHIHKREAMLKLLQSAGAKSLQQEVTVDEEEQTLPNSDGGEVNSPAENVAQDLFQAASNNDRVAAERLLAEGADAAQKNAEGKASFEIALAAEHYALAAILLQAAAGINGRDEKGWTPLNWAIFAEDWDLVRKFIREGANLDAGTQGAFDVAKLMESEANLIKSFVDEKGVDAATLRTLLILMEKKVKKERNKLFRFVMEHVADKKSWPRLLALAVVKMTPDMGGTLLRDAADQGSKDIVAALVAAGVDINSREPHNWKATPLMLAVNSGDEDTVAYLLAQDGIDIDAQDSIGRTALHRAVVSRRRNMVKLLVEAGADVNIRDGAFSNKRTHRCSLESSIKDLKWSWDHLVLDSRTPLHLATMGGDLWMVDYLLANNADPNIGENVSNNIGCSPALVIAAHGGYKDIVDTLLDRGADIDIRGLHLLTALMAAAWGGNEDMVRHLLAKGADPNVGFHESSEPWTAIQAAMSFGRSPRIVEILSAAGAEMNDKDRDQLEELERQ